MDRKKEYIAVFDSGAGGFSVLKELRRLMPEEDYVYFGDCANAPYGTRSTQAVRELTLAAAQRLLSRYPVKALVVACNTATAAAITQLREAYPHTVIIGIEPALKLAADRFPRGNIGIMATEVTLREEKLEQLLHRFPECRVEKIPAPGLVELVEQGQAHSPAAEALLEKILSPYRGKLDALVLGCTHYPFAEPGIRKALGQDILLLDGGEGTARETQRRLKLESHFAPPGGGSLILESSGDPEKLAQLASIYL